MKWFKHISDSLDDPFIYELVEEFHGDGYMVFFGVLEIYSREFSPESDWKLNIKLSFLHKKLVISSSKIKKILSKIHKWEIAFENDHVSIFIPKFREIMDEWSLRKLGSHSGVTPKILKHEADKEEDKDIYIPPISPLKGESHTHSEKVKKEKTKYSQAFIAFYSMYPKKVGKDAAWKAWQKRNDIPIADLFSIIERQKQTDQWKRGFIPNPATWLNQARWDDDPLSMNGGQNNGRGKGNGDVGARVQPPIYDGDKDLPTEEERKRGLQRLAEIKKLAGGIG